MALFEQESREGIQIGRGDEYCIKCIPPFGVIDKTLNDEEMFRLKVTGIEYCLCMDHFKELLNDKYVLVPKDQLIENNEYIKLPIPLLKNGTEEEVIEYIKKVIDNE